MIVINEGRGLEASLREYSKLCLPQGQTDFYQTDNKLVVREALGRFLADAEEGDGSVRFNHVVGGREQASRSHRVGTRKVPITELEAFEEAVRAFLQKADAEGTAPRAKEIIAHLRLPDPDLEPDMYRLYGPPWNRRLLALWGCERRQASSLPLLEAVKKLGRRFKPLWQIWVERCLWLLLLLLILAGLGVAIGSGLRGCKKPPLTGQLDKINEPATATVNGTVQSGSQYLKVTVDPATMELPSKVTARVTFPGEVDFHQQHKSHLGTGESATYGGFDTAGNYRIEWQPDANSNNIHGEFVKIAIRHSAGQTNQLIANLQPFPDSVKTGQVVHADVTASAPASTNTPVTGAGIDWTGKGEFVPLTSNSESHVFYTPGPNVVVVRLTDESGNTSMDTRVVHIDDGSGTKKPPVNKPPIPRLRLVSIDTGQLSIVVTDDGSVDPDGKIVSWSLDWGDAAPDEHFTNAPLNQGHPFAGAGTYWVSLNCVDDQQTPGHEPAKVRVVLPAIGKSQDGKGNGREPNGEVRDERKGGEIDPYIHLGLAVEAGADQETSFIAQVESFDFPVSLRVDFGDKSAPGQLTIGAAYHGDKRVETGRLSHPYSSEQDYVVTATATDRDGHSDMRKVVIKALAGREFEILHTKFEPVTTNTAKVTLLVRDKKNNNATDFAVKYWIVDSARIAHKNQQFTPEPLAIGNHDVRAGVQVSSGVIWEYTCTLTIPEEIKRVVKSVPRPGEPTVRQGPKRRP